MTSLYLAYKCNKKDWFKKAIDNTTYNPRFDKSIDKAFDKTKNKAFCKDKAQACLNRLREYKIVENQTRDSISRQVTNVLKGDNEVKYIFDLPNNSSFPITQHHFLLGFIADHYKELCVYFFSSRSATIRIGNRSIVVAIFHHIPERQGTKIFNPLCSFKH
ncbi:hypothetical protein BDC45DRAFT_571594 [Circinella umbellata]|nr:hypothetical protein BDC45DRAFT_571594 [Circinella umbellata]